MHEQALRTLLDLLEVLRPPLTRPGFTNLLVVFVGWVLTAGPHAVTCALVATGVAGRRHHEAFHRFFSRGTWQPDQLGYGLLLVLMRLVPEGAPLRLIVDDTICAKKGPAVFGLGTHVDPVRSTRRHRVFCFGHCWVVLAVLVDVPFSRRPWALPILLRLYRTKKECKRHRSVYRKKTELAREMVEVMLRWLPDRPVELAADSAYCNRTVLRGLARRVVVFGAMCAKAQLTALPPRARKGMPGRRRLRGPALQNPQALALDQDVPWHRTTAWLYGRKQTVFYKTLCAQWYRVCGSPLVRIVVVRVETGHIGFRVFFSTDPTVSVRTLLESYAGRWSIEITFKNLKQHLGFADSSARKQAAVERTAPLVALMYTTLVLWMATGVHRTALATPPLRPWYRHKRDLSFADVLRAAQRALVHLDVLAIAPSLDRLRKSTARPQPPSAPEVRQAA